MKNVRIRNEECGNERREVEDTYFDLIPAHFSLSPTLLLPEKGSHFYLFSSLLPFSGRRRGGG